MRIQFRTEIVGLAMIVTMFVMAAMAWSSAPAQMAVHWDIAGHANRYGGRFQGLLLLPLVAAGVYAFMLLAPRIDPRRRNYEAFAGPYAIVRTLVIGMLFLVYVASYLAMRGRSVNVSSMALTAMGVVFVIIGNYLPKIQPNWFIGVRTPWTLSSEESWRRTHRLAGWLFVFGGAVIAAIGLLHPAWLLWALLASMATVVLIPVIYSYFAWRQDPTRAHESLPGPSSTAHDK